MLKGDDLSSKVDNMMNVMFKQLFSAENKLAESKAVEKAQADLALREKALAAKKASATNAVKTTTDGVAESGSSLWKYLFG